MRNKINHQPITCSGSEVKEAYLEMKALTDKTFSAFKRHAEDENLKEEFYHSYVGFAIKLEEEGLYHESNMYMDICTMFHGLMDRPEVLIEHESFFRDLFKAFEKFLHAVIINRKDYERIFHEFLMYSGEMEEYYYTEVAIPSPYYDEETCKKIIGLLAGGLK